MKYRIIFWLLILAGTIFEIGGDIFFKKWVEENKTIFVIIGFLIYGIGTLFWAYSLKYENLSKAISIFTIINLIVITLLSIPFQRINFNYKYNLNSSLNYCYNLYRVLVNIKNRLN